MGETTGISWTDHTFNPWWGCMKVSPGCANCYAEAFAKRTGHQVWGPTAEYRTFGEKHWAGPLMWNAKAAAKGVTERVFCASMADVFDERGPEVGRAMLWDLILATPCLTWQLLTKRPENWAAMLPEEIPENIWLGFTAEDQEHYNVRARHLAEMNNPRFKGKFFVSYEPALGPLRIDGGLVPDWLIFGGESGPKRRPMEQKWAEDVMGDCKRHGIAFFMKQLSARTPAEGKALIPIHLQVQEFPESN